MRVSELLRVIDREPAPPGAAATDGRHRRERTGAAGYAVLDVETTGLSPRTDRIVEIAVVRADVDGSIQDRWSTRVNPGCSVGATWIHGLTDSDVAGAPCFADVVPDLNRRLAGRVVVAHNAALDLAFLRAEYHNAGWTLPFVPALCTLEVSARVLPQLGRRRLVDCCWACDVALADAHSALGDASATAGLLGYYIYGSDRRLPAELAELSDAARSLHWPDGPSHSPAAPPAVPSPAWVRRRSPVARPLVELLDNHSLADALDEGAPTGSLPYLETLAEALEDGVLTEAEHTALADVAAAYGMTGSAVAAAHHAFMTALAHQALVDRMAGRAERAELEAAAELLRIDRRIVGEVLDQAESARLARLSEGLEPLPPDWSLGEPLRVGQKVVFTGCDPALRTGLEARAQRLGVRVVGAVSARVAMLVTDGTFSGTKAAAAAELDLRRVTPEEFGALLDHLQPAEATRARPAGAAEPAEIRHWARSVGYAIGSRGRLDAALLAAYEARSPGERAAGDRPELLAVN